MQNLFGKYRNIVISIALFLMLDASVLMLNFYISFQISEDAAGVNLAGRQRMLSQRMTKSLYDMKISFESENERTLAERELSDTVTLFDTTLTAFDRGGAVKGASGESLTLQAASTDAALSALAESKKIWADYKPLISNVLSAKTDAQKEQSLAAAIAFASENNLKLLRLMNDLTVELERVASSKAARLRIIQTIGISLAIVNFFIILFHFLKQLRESDEKIERARKETQEILDTVNEGLFLLDKNQKIGTQYSRVLHSMFERDDIAENEFSSILKDIVTEKVMAIANRFIALLFKEDIKSNLIQDLNPLSEIEVSIPNAQGEIVRKFFSFSFERVYENEKIRDVLVTVADVTGSVLLARELAVTKEQNEKQIELLTGILHASSELLGGFLSNTRASATKMNSILKEPAKSATALRKKLNQLFVEIHRIKGESAALDLEVFEVIAHEFESHIQNIKDKVDLSGDDFLPLVVRLEYLVNQLDAVDSMSEKLRQLNRDESSKSVSDVSKWNHLRSFAETVASRNGKTIQLTMAGLSEHSLSEEQSALVSDFAIQSIRNAIFHGIEEPEFRKSKGKSSVGRLDLRLTAIDSGMLELSLKDDGKGIDIKELKEKAIESGRISTSDAEKLGHKHIASLIFESSFSSAAEHGRDAGGGVGLNVVRDRVSALGGRIRLLSKKGQGLEIRAVFPVQSGSDFAA